MDARFPGNKKAAAVAPTRPVEAREPLSFFGARQLKEQSSIRIGRRQEARLAVGESLVTRLFGRLVPLAVAMSLVTGCSLLAPRQRAAEESSHVVVAGDTLHEIGERFGVPASEIQRHNGITDPRQLQVGQVLRIPSVGPLDMSSGTRIFSGQSPPEPKASLRMVSITPVKGLVGHLGTPVKGAKQTSHFGWRWSRFHEGADLAAREGTPVLAAHDGTVVLVMDSWGRYGKVVVLQGDGIMTVYGHNHRNHVEKGEEVSKGDHIADVGSTGDTTGPHLHFETRVRDENGAWAAINPVTFYPKSQ